MLILTDSEKKNAEVNIWTRERGNNWRLKNTP
jgi:hypothetical protein